jgi:GT2 family glycosyltransferase
VRRRSKDRGKSEPNSYVRSIRSVDIAGSINEASAGEWARGSSVAMTRRGVGAVVIGRNEGARLIACLRSIGERVKPVIYVDSGSTDGSPAAAARLGATVVALDVSQPFTAARARNAGFAALGGGDGVEFVQFVDGDCELAEGWLDEAASFLTQRPDVAAVCGRRRERHPDASVFNRLCDIEWNTPPGEAAACGGDALMRVFAFAAVGGFDETLMAGEEPELCSRLRARGWKIWRLDADMTVHDAAMTRLSQWWRRGVRSGYGYAQVWSATKGRPERLYGAELRRALIWAGLVPALILLAALASPAAGAAMSLVYPLQVMRIAIRRAGSHAGAWAYAAFMVLAKFAELQGILRFFRQPGRPRALIEYKAG